MVLADSALLLRLQTEVLEAVACGEPLLAIADMLCRRAEELAPDAICSILSVDAEGVLHPLAAPSLPLAYSSAIEGLSIGPCSGSCGTAAFRNEPVIVTDIATDPLWDDYRGLAGPLGLSACWSSPIQSRDGRVVATFAFYFRTPRAPNDLERSIVATCLHLCAIAIEHEQVRERNYRLAYFDALTGLPNRGHFNELLTRHVGMEEPFGLLLVDIDHLKVVNDTVGHVFGDLLIRTVAERIAAADPSLLACRLGGDEFAVLVTDCANERTLKNAATRMLASVRGLIQAGEQTLDPHITIGGALFGPDGIDGASLSQNADFALYHAKEIRRGGYIRFSPGLRTSMLERASMVRSVDSALSEHRMLAHYQPIVRLETAEIVGLEALARMQMPDGRIASAGEFHAALADPRIAWQLTGQMLDQVASDIRNWLDMGMDFQHVGINVTTGDFQRGDLEHRIVDTFERAGVPLKHIILEVNEAVFMGGSDQMVPKAVGALRKRGLLVALDDFGTGFASLTHLLSFPVDVIKIDKSFVDRIGTGHASDVVVGAIIDIARKLDMKIVAEGIETAEQAEALSKLGCTLGQGYLFARPGSVEDTTRLLSMFAQKPTQRPEPSQRLIA
ncbi:putative bifunctional diguanylate cyclase/phosphodiesterase [Devosia sp. SL43]|uniref:putative bifunctional diguanylate cyclase/phosphodiesterase n=1 Tax=Devosia sp. SL43 TaxID=2806348 RepID=UPI001F261DCE|nr:EAL domain-containing protein [Devosia sp. SL43]UJW85123.1 EAL domain-containing protein [Devosia sp. SL43]